MQSIEPGQDARGAVDQAVTAVVAHVSATRRHLHETVQVAAGDGCASADEHSLRRLEVAAADVLRSNLGDVRLRAGRLVVLARLADALAQHRHVEEDGGLLLRLEQSVPPQASMELAQRLTDGLNDSPSRPHPWVWRVGWLQRGLHAPLRRLDAIRDVLDNRIPHRRRAAWRYNAERVTFGGGLLATVATGCTCTDVTIAPLPSRRPLSRFTAVAT